MGWGKTLLAGVGGFIVGGPVGAALAAGAVAAGSKVVDAYNKDMENEKKNTEEASKNEQMLKTLEDERQKRTVKETAPTPTPTKQKKRIKYESIKINDQLIIACAAMGMATATCDGAISSDESGELMLFLKELNGNQEFSPSVKARVDEYYANPPKFMKAKKEVDKVEGVDKKLFRALIEAIIHSDNEVSPEEVDFLEKWDTFYPETKEN